MMNYIPELKAHVEILPLDTGSNERYYLVSIENKWWKITKYLYDILMLVDGEKSISDIISEYKKSNDGKEVNHKEIIRIIDLIRKKGLLRDSPTDTDGDATGRNKYLWLRVPFIKSSFIERAKFLTFLFSKKISISFLTLGLIIHILCFLNFDITKNYFELMNISNVKFFYIMLITMITVVFHEFGHMISLMKYKMKPGNIGFGIYMTFPVLYSDVHNAWKLKRKERAVVDVGGVYFSFIFNSVYCIVGLLTGLNWVVFAATINTIKMISNFNPFLKMDGYWLMSDLIGIPNLHTVSQDFLLSVMNKVFGGEYNFSLAEYNKKAIRIFYGYTALFVLYIGFYIFGLWVLFVNLLKRLPLFIELINSIKIAPDFLSIVKRLADSFADVLLLLIIIRIALITLRKVIKIIIYISNKIKESLIGRKNFGSENH